MFEKQKSNQNTKKEKIKFCVYEKNNKFKEEEQNYFFNQTIRFEENKKNK